MLHHCLVYDANYLFFSLFPTDELVAVKLMSKETTPKDNFLMEYGMSLSLSSHPNIIATHEIVFHTSSDYVFVQEVAPDGNLSIAKPNCVCIKNGMK